MPSSTDLMIELHSDHARALWGFALRLTGGDRAHAEDVVQETLLRAWRDRRILRSTTAGTRAWLFTVARRLVIDEWRSSRSPVSYTHLRAHETDSYLVCRLLLEKKK